MLRVTLLTAAALLAAAPAASAAYDENQNWLNAYGRTVDHFTAPDRSVGTALISAGNALTTIARDGGKVPDRGLQQTGAWPWSGDARRGSYDHAGAFTGRKVELTFPNEQGQDLAATVWAPSDERLDALGLAAPLPGVVYAPGVISAQPMYYWFAQDMADAGYVVLTYDLDGQGRSEGYSQTDPDGDLRSALRFFLSQANPLRDLLDGERIGTAGHSLGAFAVQDVGDFGGVVKAISAHSDMRSTYAGSAPLQGQGADYESFVFPPQPSPGADPLGKLGAFLAQRDRGIDVQEVVIEAGTHMAWSHVTWAYTSVWSEAVALHYALAWFDRYLYGDLARRDGVPAPPGKGGVTATRRLTMDFDAVGDHGLSQKYRSAYALSDLEDPDGGFEHACEDMTGRGGCTQPGPKAGRHGAARGAAAHARAAALAGHRRALAAAR